MSKVWHFQIVDGTVTNGSRKRKQLTPTGCNEPFKDRYWCPKKQWFSKESCPFVSKRECENYALMCGGIL